jgi:L-ribulose-5-phosphate 4-epimerase
MTPEEINGEYEKETGTVIIEAFRNLNPMSIPAVLVKSHGPFAWGTSAKKAVENALVLEECAYMAYITRTLTGDKATCAPKALMDKHYFRKHGVNATYGQRKI